MSGTILGTRTLFWVECWFTDHWSRLWSYLDEASAIKVAKNEFYAQKIKRQDYRVVEIEVQETLLNEPFNTQGLIY